MVREGSMISPTDMFRVLYNSVHKGDVVMAMKMVDPRLIDEEHDIWKLLALTSGVEFHEYEDCLLNEDLYERVI